jgi:RHS repeat-associated protein
MIDDTFEWSPAGGLVSYYSHAGQVIAMRNATGLHWMFGDQLGSNSTVRTPAGTNLRQRYQPYGRLRGAATLPTEYGYTGQRLDPTGLMDYNARQYDPLLGRFTSPDTIIPDPADPQAFNRYTYVNNNPVNMVDPSGHLGFGPGLGMDFDPTGGAEQGSVDPHLALDAFGLVPVVGEVADLTNAVWYAAEGNWGDAGLSAVSVIPVVGDLLGKGGRVCVEFCDEGIQALTDATSHSDEIAGGLCSFSEDTQVVTGDGDTTSISDIEPGDQVLAGDPETGLVTVEEVTHTWMDDDVLVEAVIGGNPVWATDDHPVWNVSDGEWQPLCTVGLGELLSTVDGGTVTFDGFTGRSVVDKAYNLTVTGPHTYYIQAGDNTTLAHNTCGGGPRNAHLAGETHPSTGVPFDSDGYPDFSAWRHPDVPDVRIELSGSRSTDFGRANRAAGLGSTPEGYTWHHHQDPGLMQLVDRVVHRATGHTGGFSMGKVQ